MRAIPTNATPFRLAERVQPALGVIIPAANEEASIAHILRATLAQPCVGQVVVVDDGSTDGTLAAVEAFEEDERLTILRHPRRMGKGWAIRTGLTAITQPIVMIQDADTEYDPADYPEVVAPILSGRADVVFGVRGLGRYITHSLVAVVGDRLVTTVANLLFNTYLRDLETGVKAIRRELLDRMDLKAKGFEIEPEITANLLRRGYAICEVPISYYARSRTEGKKFRAVDWARAIAMLVRIRFRSNAQIAVTSVPSSYTDRTRSETSDDRGSMPSVRTS